jgi:hypothetical protein
MSFQYYRLQAGQAMLEALFILLIFMTLMFAMQYSGQLRAHSLALLGESSYQSFLQSLKKHMPQNPPSTQLSEQLLEIKGDSLIKIQANQIDTPYKRSAANRLFTYSSIQRTSYLHVNAGESRSAQEVQSRIARSTSAWSDTTDISHSVLEPHRVPLAKIDAPWGRGMLTTDWLTGWTGQSPGMKLKEFRP